MELLLANQAGTQISVTCDGQPSHTLDLQILVPNKEKGPPQPLDDPVTYGKAVYQALFPPGMPASHALNQELQRIPARILLVTTDDDLDALPWEYAYGPDGFLVLECHFVRGLPAGQHTPPPTLDSGLHIVAIPSSPLDKDIPALDIDGEWMRLKEIVEIVPYAITLERTRPPTIEQARALLANQRHRIVHFMGHGGQQKDIGAFLCFEKENADLDPVTAKQFVLGVRGTVFLVTLNACVSATPGPTLFSNLAAALVRQKVPYALGMRFSIHDDDARAFSRTFYNDLARSSSVEEALFQARLTLANRARPWVVGVPVLYTSLAQPAAGFASHAGTPTIKEHQPHMEVSALPRAEEAFQGRIDELKALGKHLTGDGRPRIVTIHGGGGQGKTALAREAVERFAHAWPGGVWATSLENLPRRATFVADLARFLGILTQEIADPAEVERRVLILLIQRRMLLVLDNAETLVDAVERNDATALHLVEFIKQLPGPSVSLLVTSRVQLGWISEVSYELGGLSQEEGADLFRQSAPQRTNEIAPALAQELSRKLEGHPLGLLLLGKAFNASAISLHAFLQECDAQLAQAEDKYVGPEHRHRTLNACIEMSVRYLAADLRGLLSGLWIFHAPFLAEAATALFDPEHEDGEENRSPIRDRLYILWQRSLLAREETTVRDGTVQFYHLLPTTRPYVEHYLEQAYEREKLLAQFGAAYSHLANALYSELDRSATTVTIAQQAREDLVRGVEYVAGEPQGYYLWYCGSILHRLGNPRHGLALLERALEIAQGQDQTLELHVLNNMAVVYQATGQPQEALRLYDQALPITREVGDRAGEAAMLNNMAVVYRTTGQPQEALRLYDQALPITREVGNRAWEAATLNNMALVYQAIGKPQEGLQLYDQALPITREVGDRPGEAAMLNGLAYLLQSMHRYAEALTALEQSITLARQIVYRALEAAGLVRIALLLYRHLNRTEEAITQMEQAIAVLVHTDLPQDAEGQTPEDLRYLLQAMRGGVSLGEQTDGPSTMPAAEVQQIVDNTVAVMTTAQEHRVQWREAMANALQDAQQRGSDRLIEVDLFTAVLDILDGRLPTLPTDHPYAQAVAAIQEGIAAGRPQMVEVSNEVMQAVRDFVNAKDWEATRQVVEAQQILLFRPEVERLFEENIAQARTAGNRQVVEVLELQLALLRMCKMNGITLTFEQLTVAQEINLPFDEELITRSIEALVGSPQAKMAHMQYLATQFTQTTDAGLKTLIDTIQLALFSNDLSQLGQNLHGVYLQAWQIIVAGVKTEGGSSS